uniref:Uncharacterized protein n=1 Tax=Megaselia scalaris TaxID=36166 RepID=T1GM37_MEGSC
MEKFISSEMMTIADFVTDSVTETREHILYECPALMYKRNSIFETYLCDSFDYLGCVDLRLLLEFLNELKNQSSSGIRAHTFSKLKRPSLKCKV